MRRMFSLKQLKEIANAQVQEQVSSGNLQNVKVFEEIIDKDGHKRFIDSDGNVYEVITNSYCKWSLSGTHLLLVLAGTIPDEGVIPAYHSLALFEDIPSWVLDKIVPVWASTNIERKTIDVLGDDWTSQELPALLQKSDNKLIILLNKGTDFTATADRHFRVEFDLLIDND